MLGKAARPTNRSVFPDSLVFGCTVSTRERAACRSLRIHYADTGSPLRLFVNTKSAAITLCKLGSNFLTALQADTGERRPFIRVKQRKTSLCPLLAMFRRGVSRFFVCMAWSVTAESPKMFRLAVRLEKLQSEAFSDGLTF